jgi:hypothetical protein
MNIYHVQILFIPLSCLVHFKGCVTSVKITDNTLVLLSSCDSAGTWADGPDNVQSKAAWNIKLVCSVNTLIADQCT